MPRSINWVYDSTKPEALAGLESLRAMGYQCYQSTYPLEFHDHPNAFEFVFMEKARATWEVDGIYYPTNAGDVFCTRPNEVHRARYSVIEPSHLWWFIINTPEHNSAHGKDWLLPSAEEAQELIDRLQRLPRVLHIGQSFAKQFHLLRQHLEQRDRLYVSKIRTQLLNMLFMITDHADQTQVKPTSVDFKAYLTSQFQSDWSWRPTIDEIAQHFGYSPSHFHKLFREHVGLSPIAYTERLRTEQACRLLEQTDDSITTISNQLGYASSQHFASMFLRYSGYTPSQWRLQYAKLFSR